MKKIMLALPLLLASPAFANGYCDDLWFTRNLVMDRAGYCFGSTLGKTWFDNGDCTGKSVTPDQAGQRLVARIQGKEAEASCKGRVNTRGRDLDVGDIGIRMQLTDLPIVADQPKACVRWRGEVTVLHAGKQVRNYAFGLIEPGDTISFDHQREDGWAYVTAHDFDGRSGPWSLKSGGWIMADQIGLDDCAYWLP